MRKATDKKNEEQKCDFKLFVQLDLMTKKESEKNNFNEGHDNQIAIWPETGRDSWDIVKTYWLLIAQGLGALFVFTAFGLILYFEY